MSLENIPSTLPKGWIRSFDGNAVIWKMRSSWAWRPWCIGGEQSLRISRNRLESGLRWLGWSRKKVFTDAAFRLEAFFDNHEDPRTHVWKWFLEVHGPQDRELLFLATLGYLSMEFPETMISELSRLTGWPAKTIFTYQEQPPPSTSFD